MPDRPETLKRRREFLLAARSRKWVTPGLVLQVRTRGEKDRSHGPDTVIRFGLTASRKVGGAVRRNRIRRRLRALAQEILTQHGRGGRDYVLIGRWDTATRPHEQLVKDLRTALRRLDSWRDDVTPTPEQAPERQTSVKSS